MRLARELPKVPGDYQIDPLGYHAYRYAQIIFPQLIGPMDSRLNVFRELFGFGLFSAEFEFIFSPDWASNPEYNTAAHAVLRINELLYGGDWFNPHFPTLSW